MWYEWYKRQWNAPSLTDHYLMQVCAEIRNFMQFLLAKTPRPARAGDFQIKFKFSGRKTEEQLALEREQLQTDRNLAAKMKWSAFLGVNLLDPEQAIRDGTLTVAQP